MTAHRLRMCGYNKKESVELISLSFGGSGKPGTNKQYPTLVSIYKNGAKHPY